MTTVNLIELTKLPIWYNTLLVGMLVSAFIMALIAGLITNKKSFSNAVFIASITLIVITAIFSLNAVEEFFKVPSGKFHIEATFSDDMPFNSVMKEYNIVEQRENTFVLEPKERKVD